MSESQESVRRLGKSALHDFHEEMTLRLGNRYLQYREKYKKAANFVFEPEAPLYVMLEQTFKCNLRCPSCVQGYDSLIEQNDTKNIMSFPAFCSIVDQLKRYDCPSISMMVNDEPLLVKSIAERVKYCSDAGIMEIFLTTNGQLATREKLEELFDAGLTHLLFSIDAATEETYNLVRPPGKFSKVLEVVKLAHQIKKERKTSIPLIRASFVESKTNIAEKNLFVEVFGEYVDKIEFQGFSVLEGFNNHLIPDGAQRIENFHCIEPWQKLIVRSNGDVNPCCSWNGYDIKIGNVFQQDLKTLFNSDKMKQLRADAQAGSYQDAACQKCSKSFHVIRQ